MPRLPQPGADANQWGDILNDYLSQAHQANGALKDGVITRTKISTVNNPQSGQSLTWNGANLAWTSGTAVNLANLKAVAVYANNAYPARPSGYGSVEWIGPVDPGSAAQNNDTWVNTSE